MTAFEVQYAEAEPSLRKELHYFRENNQEKQLSFDGYEWSYYDIGDKRSPVILWLVGGLRMADAAFRSIPMLQPDFRIIAPSYPPVETMAQLADGLKAILKAASIQHCSVLAGSFGGMIAQVFVRRHSKTVNKLILSTTIAPDQESITRYQQLHEMVISTPEDVVMQTAKSQMYDMVAPSPNESNFWKAYIDELYTDRLTHADIVSTYACILDYMTNYQFQPDDLKHWHGEILIIDSENDQVFTKSSREDVQRLYPQAHSHTFANAGHSPASSQREIYFDIVRKFLHE